MAAPNAPGIAINAVDASLERNTVVLGATFTGGTYDANRIVYAWSLRHANGNLWDNSAEHFDNVASATPTFTFPDVSADTNIQIRLDCTFHGTGSEASQTVTAFDLEPTASNHVPDADAPSAVISVPATADGNRPFERETIVIDAPQLGLTHAGRFDNLTFEWEAFWYGVNRADDFLVNKHSQQTHLTVPDVADGAIDQLITLKLNVTAIGTNGGGPYSGVSGPALKDTADTRTVQFRLFVRDRPNANAPAPTNIRRSTLNTDQADPPAVDDDSWVDGMGSGKVGEKMWVQAIFSGPFPEDLPNDPGVAGEDTWDGPLEYAWRLGFERTDSSEPIPEGDGKRVFLYTRKRTDTHERGDRQNLQVTVTARGNDVNAEVGTVSHKRHVTPTGFTEFPPDPHIGRPRILPNPFPNVIERAVTEVTADLVPNIGRWTAGTETYEWQLTQGSGDNFRDLTTDSTFDDRHARVTNFNAPTVDSDTQYTLQVKYTVRGIPPEYADKTLTFFGQRDLTVLDHRPADAPSVEITDVATGRAGTNVRLTARIGLTHAGRYDSLTYRWHLYEGTSGTDIAANWLDDVTARDPELTRPGKQHTRSTDYSLVLAVTAHGDDHLAAGGSSHTIRSAVRHFTIQPLPLPTNPDSVTINPIPDGVQGETADLSVTIEKGAGRYDDINTEWLAGVEGSGAYPPLSLPQRGNLSLRWTRPQVAQDTVYRIALRYTAVGDGEEARPESFANTGASGTWPSVHVTTTVLHDSASLDHAVYVSDDAGVATQITDIYVTDADGTATRIAAEYVTDADGTAQQING